MPTPAIGVIGSGVMGANHVRVLSSQLGAEVLIHDASSARADEVARTFGVESVPLKELLTRCDGVIVATPPASHVTVAGSAIDRGLPTLVEKPVGLSSADCDELEQRASHAGGVVATGFVERWNPAFLTIQQMLRPDERLISIDHVRVGPAALQVAAGVVLDLMVHDLDLALHLCRGMEIGSANGVTASTTALPGEDLAVAICTVGDVIVTVRSSRINHGRSRLLKLITSEREIIADLAKHTIEAMELGAASFQTQDGLTLRETVTIERPFVTSTASPLEAQLAAFVGVCQGGESQLPTLADARRVHRIVESMELKDHS